MTRPTADLVFEFFGGKPAEQDHRVTKQNRNPDCQRYAAVFETGWDDPVRSRGSRVRFEVNLSATQKAGLTLSSELLKVATVVRRILDLEFESYA